MAIDRRDQIRWRIPKISKFTTTKFKNIYFTNCWQPSMTSSNLSSGTYWNAVLFPQSKQLTPPYSGGSPGFTSWNWHPPKLTYHRELERVWWSESRRTGAIENHHASMYNQPKNQMLIVTTAEQAQREQTKDFLHLLQDEKTYERDMLSYRGLPRVVGKQPQEKIGTTIQRKQWRCRRKWSEHQHRVGSIGTARKRSRQLRHNHEKGGSKRW